ncbi:helix-turn-helix transcriptional regulator [Dactylosporangium sp. CS-033363]|uniref:helix-turn-helix transcriptional regulator n=1 Tax=Dactylosporangium sp. CS-033363 TaxID=3239935 RepID=UPI003D8D6ADE
MHDSPAELGATLRAWRDRLTPAAVGLPSGRVRRAPGLRREELAQLAGLSVDYVVRLEQGRSTTPSPQVVAALARALQLGDGERDHLYRLSGLAPPAEGEISDHITPGLHRVLNRLGDTAVALFAADWQLIWWNRCWAALLGDPSAAPAERRNFARATFPVNGETPALSDREVRSSRPDAVAAAIVSDLRQATGRFPHSRRLLRLIRTLEEGNERFAALWAEGAVGAHREDHKVIHHPSIGPIELDCDVVTEGDADRKIVILTAAPDSEDEIKLRLALLADAAAG